jgi:hypothetical protein
LALGHAEKTSSLIMCVCCLKRVTGATAVSGWSNGGYSANPSNPDYGTHDWIAEHALDWLPLQEKQFLLDNKASYLYGTELPDNNQAPDGIGDTTKHHVYFFANGSVQDDAAADRATAEYVNAVHFFNAGNLSEAAKRLGMVAHYIADMAVFGHVMGAATAWGAEAHHSDYEQYVLTRTDNYADEFNVFLAFDGNLGEISAYDAALTLAHDTTFDADGDLTCVWMDQHYNWGDVTFRNRCGESLSLAVNLIADVLHSFYIGTIIPENTFFTSCFLIWFCFLGLILILKLFRGSSLSPKREHAPQGT